MTFEFIPYRFSNGKYERLRVVSLIQKSVRELVNDAYVLKTNLPTEGLVYFLGTDEPYQRLKSQNKTIKWLHDLFEGIRQELVEKGFSPSKSIYNWSIEEIMAHGKEGSE